MAQYGSHTTCTLNYMESYLEDFHKHKDILLKFWAYKKTGKDPENRIKVLNTSCFQSAQRGLEEIREIRERFHFNFIKLHLLSHYREHIELFEGIPRYSTNISELAHTHQIKEAYVASNKLNTAVQILSYVGWRLVLEIRMLDLKNVVGGTESTDHILWSHRENLRELLEILIIEDQKKTFNQQTMVEGGLPLNHFCNLSTKSEGIYNIRDGLRISHTTLYRLIKKYAEDVGCSQSFSESSKSILEHRMKMFTCFQVLMPIFQRPAVYEVHNIKCIETCLLGKGK
jgi:hypothetical protein